ncbi:hypothetical protein ACTXPP_11375 [Candidatus Corynebacterium faecigallinarum]|uniref:hypothetical protein n=1 Tax=Candidatus Corynebacterium faecigallinarum TaxID=2838528 RepID=UPI003FD456A3
MFSIDLYHDLDLDRSKTPSELAAELDHRLRGVSWDDKATHEQLTVARRILGNPTRRQMYDQRLANPSASIDIDQLRGLAYQDVKQPPASLSAVSTVAVDKVRRFYRTDRKPKVAGTAVAGVAVLGLVGAGVASCGNDDDGNTSATGGGGTRVSTEDDNGENPAVDSARDGFAEYNFLSAGGDLEIRTGTEYEFDDGSTQRGKDGGRYTVTVDNPRTMDVMGDSDPNAPEGHPDAERNLSSVLFCYDMTAKVIEEPEEPTNRPDDPQDYLESMLIDALGQPELDLNPIIDGGHLGPTISTNQVMIPVGAGTLDEIDEIQNSMERVIRATDPSQAVREGGGYADLSVSDRSTTVSACRSVDVDTADFDDFTGYVLSTEVGSSADIENDPEPRGWRFDAPYKD